MQIKPIHLKTVQLFAEIAIPLLGYFFWDWGFYFILLFFLLDYFVFLVFSFIKHRKIVQERTSLYLFPIKQVFYSSAILIFTLLLIYITLPLIGPFDFSAQTWAFLSYKEMGIPQGILLFPLLIYGGYAQYKMQFLMNGNFKKVTATANWKTHFFFMWIVCLAALSFFLLSSFFVFPEFIYVATLLVTIAGFKWFF